jgi:hypothetical protein
MSAPARQQIASRSATAPETLVRPCCLRCSKNFGKTPTIKCTKLGHRRVCERCAKMNKKCFPVRCFPSPITFLTIQVPQACVPRLNRLIRLVDDALKMNAGPAKEAAVATIQSRQSAYTKIVEATVRAETIPPTIQGMGQAILTALAQAQTSLDGIVDVLRFQVSPLVPPSQPLLIPKNNLPPIARDNPDNDEEDEEDAPDDGGVGSSGTAGGSGA